MSAEITTPVSQPETWQALRARNFLRLMIRHSSKAVPTENVALLLEAGYIEQGLEVIKKNLCLPGWENVGEAFKKKPTLIVFFILALVPGLYLTIDALISIGEFLGFPLERKIISQTIQNMSDPDKCGKKESFLEKIKLEELPSELLFHYGEEEKIGKRTIGICLTNAGRKRILDELEATNWRLQIRLYF